MASLQEQMAKLSPEQRKRVEKIRSRGIGFSSDVGGIEGLAEKSGKSSSSVGIDTSGGLIRGSSKTQIQQPEQPQQFEQTPDIMEQFRALQEAKTRAQIASLERAKQSQLSALAGEESQVKPQFQEARRGAITEAERGRAGFDKFLAQRGLSGSGAGAQADIAQNVARQGALTGLRQQESEKIADIARRRSGIESAFAGDVAAAEAGGQAQLLQNLINQQNIDRQLGIQQEQFEANQRLSEAGLTGLLDGQLTLAGQQSQQQGQLFQLQQQQIQQSLEAGEISNEQAQFALDQARDPDSVANQSAKIALEIAQIQLENLPEQTRLAIETAKKQLAQIGRQPILSEVQKAQNELALLQINNEIKRLTSGGNTFTPDIDTLQSGIESVLGRLQPGGFDDLNEPIVTPTQQINAIAEQIAQLVVTYGLGAEETADLLSRNGISPEQLEEASKRLGLIEGFVEPTGTFRGLQ